MNRDEYAGLPPITPRLAALAEAALRLRRRYPDTPYAAAAAGLRLGLALARHAPEWAMAAYDETVLWYALYRHVATATAEDEHRAAVEVITGRGSGDRDVRTRERGGDGRAV